jgi:ATP adenylyltransferase
MKPVWAPWRIEYVTKGREKGCIFCDKPKEKKDRKNLILYRGSAGFIIMNRFPYSNGHIMVVPYRHMSKLSNLNESERLDLMNLSIIGTQALEVLRPDGFNIGMNIGRVAGAGIDDHIHFHVVPRWNGDTNFMPVVADVKVIPEYLDQTYLKLFEELKNIGR